MESCKIFVFGGFAGMKNDYMLWLLTDFYLNFKVICVVADGATGNRRFFSLHKIAKYQKSDVTYKAPNIYLQEKFVYFMCDVPHLIKTVRNAWCNSRDNGTRHLEVIL